MILFLVVKDSCLLLWLCLKGFEEKQKDLLSKLRKQDQKVLQLEKEKLQLVNMIEKFHLELQKLNEAEV